MVQFSTLTTISSQSKRSALRQHANPSLVVSGRGRPRAVSNDVIEDAIAAAEERDLNKDSCTSGADVMSVVDEMRREELTQLGRNPHATLPVLSRSTRARLVRRVTPVTVRNGSVQNSSRQRALRDARNAISCAATWLAVSDGILNGNFVHSWDECSLLLNAFNEKQTVKCTAAGRKKLSDRNLAPATTATQQQRRTLKIGLSK